MITANRRARATIAFFIPRRLAICIAQALGQTATTYGTDKYHLSKFNYL
jgi:hypothetical protein